jgi:AcrR family transcriptional regulator
LYDIVIAIFFIYSIFKNWLLLLKLLLFNVYIGGIDLKQNHGNQFGKSLSVPSSRTDANRNNVKILDAAKKVFATVGLDATMEDIAKKAQVGIGTLYRRYKNKDQLAVAVVLDILGELYEKHDQLSQEAYPADKKIGLVFQYFTEISEKYGKIHDLVITLLNSKEWGSNLEKPLIYNLKSVFSDIIVQGQEEGIFKKGNTKAYEILIFSMINPRVLNELRGVMSVKEIPNYLSEVILYGLRK